MSRLAAKSPSPPTVKTHTFSPWRPFTPATPQDVRTDKAPLPPTSYKRHLFKVNPPFRQMWCQKWIGINPEHIYWTVPSLNRKSSVTAQAAPAPGRHYLPLKQPPVRKNRSSRPVHHKACNSAHAFGVPCAATNHTCESCGSVGHVPSSPHCKSGKRGPNDSNQTVSNVCSRDFGWLPAQSKHDTGIRLVYLPRSKIRTTAGGKGKRANERKERKQE